MPERGERRIRLLDVCRRPAAGPDSDEAHAVIADARDLDEIDELEQLRLSCDARYDTKGNLK